MIALCWKIQKLVELLKIILEIPEFENGIDEIDGKLPYCLLGGACFPLTTWIMRPYPGNLSEAEFV